MKILKTRDSRTKVRRWTFEAQVKTADMDIVQTLKLDSMFYGNSKDMQEHALSQQHALRSANKAFEDAEIKIVAIPQETVSAETIAQINHGQSMFIYLDKALELAIQDLHPGEMNLDFRALKEHLFKRALDVLKPRVDEVETNVDEAAHSIVLTDAAVSGV